MNKYLVKIAFLNREALKHSRKLLAEIASSGSNRLPSSLTNLYSKGFTKNVDAIINSRAINPEMARPYANYIELAGHGDTSNAIIHRLNHFKEIPRGGW